VEPAIHHSHVNEAVDPFLIEHFCEIIGAEAGADTGEEPVIEAIPDAFHSFGEDPGFAPADIAGDFRSFDRYKWGDIAHAAHLSGLLVGDELAISENLEVAIGMPLKQVKQVGVQEGLAAKQAELDFELDLNFDGTIGS
jgi:hypothetical protein